MKNIAFCLLGAVGCIGEEPAPACLLTSDWDGCPLDGQDNDCDGAVDEDCVPSDDSGEGAEAPNSGAPGIGAPGSGSCFANDDCADEDDCTTDICSIEGCVNISQCSSPESCTLTSTSDCDQDGVTPAGGDCDDTDPYRSPLLLEAWEAGNLEDWVDNDCDIVADEWGLGPDTDGDRVPDRTDCDPMDARRWPGAPELCDDGVDSECDGNDNSDAWGSCFITVGAIDGMVYANTFERVAILGSVTSGLADAASSDITTVTVTSEANGWEVEDTWWTPYLGDAQLYELHIPRVAFIPRVRLADGSNKMFDLREWQLTGNLRRAPDRLGRWATVLVAP